MKKYLLFLLALIFIVSCGRVAKEKIALVKINNYEISKEEFEDEFKASSFGRIGSLASRKEFLDNLINRKLILQDAQRRGLGQDKGFLKMIERFWEQSLLKLALDKKSKEIAGSALVSDKTIEEGYQKMLRDGKTDKSYDQMYQQIKWEITKLKETKAMNDWVAWLRKKAEIKINDALLKLDK